MTGLKRLVFAFRVALLPLFAIPAAGAAGQAPADSADRPWTVARRIQAESDLLQGPAAEGRPGDYLLRNDRLIVIIDAPERSHGFARSGGNILDADVARPGPHSDEIQQVFTYFEDRFGSMAAYDRIEVSEAGGYGEPASLTVTGAYSEDPFVRITTRYRIEPGQSHITIETEVANLGQKDYPSFALGDAIQWGRTRAFAPGNGFTLRGHTPDLAWMAGQGERVSYGWTVAEGIMKSRHGSGWSDLIVSEPRLRPGNRISFTRRFVVGAGDISSVAGPMLAMRNEPFGQVQGQVREDGGGPSIPQAIIEVFDAGNRMVLAGISDNRGAFRLALPPGRYQAHAYDKGRQPAAKSELTVEDKGVHAIDLPTSREGRLRYFVFDNQGRTAPAKLTFAGRGDTPTPNLGPRHTTSAENTHLTASGTGEIPFPPGDYDVVVSRGPEYHVHRSTLTVVGGSITDFRATLRPAFETRGWIGADLHIHAEPSYDCAVSLESRITSLVAEGVEFAVASDHDVVTDYRPAIEALGVGGALQSCLGVEVTTRQIGHFNIFPLEPRANHIGEKFMDHEGKSMRDIAVRARSQPGERIVQVNHPRAENIGYFSLHNLNVDKGTADDGFSWNFETLEIWNGRYVEEAVTNLFEWFRIINKARRPTATGGSDSHLVFSQEVGYPRTYVACRSDNPAEISGRDVTQALKNGHAFVTNGPFLTFRINEQGRIGDTVKAAPGDEVLIEFEVWAADWVDVTEVALVENGRVIRTEPVPATSSALRARAQMKRIVKTDSWYVLTARGTRSLDPVVPDLPDKPMLPFAFTNPIFVDTDGDGRYHESLTPTAPAAGRN